MQSCIQFPSVDRTFIGPGLQAVQHHHGVISARIAIVTLCALTVWEALAHATVATGKLACLAVQIPLSRIAWDSAPTLSMVEVKAHAVRTAKLLKATICVIPRALVNPDCAVQAYEDLGLWIAPPSTMQWTLKALVVGLKTLGIYGIALPILDICLRAFIWFPASQQMGIGFGSYLPHSVGLLANVCTASLTFLISYVVRFPLGINDDHFLNIGIIGPIAEEVVYRGLVQEMCMRRLPKKILSKIAPKYEWAVDSVVAKTMRIVATSFIFAIAHFDRLEPSRGGGLAEFFNSIVDGYLMESTQSIVKSSLSHMGHNTIMWTAIRYL